MRDEFKAQRDRLSQALQTISKADREIPILEAMLEAERKAKAGAERTVNALRHLHHGIPERRKAA